MRVHISGIGGTFMAGVALLARAAGHRVTGSDQGLYPPMSTQLAEAGIDVFDGYTADNLAHRPDQVVLGNALSRGNAEVEAVLDSGLPYTSGPQWLAENVLTGRHVLAVAGTHGKTTTASMLAWILERAGLKPGFLIGGIPGNFGISARLGEGECFVVEADEYDTAFFDKRSKFVHYRPRTLVLNNLEFDHADIFDDLAAIQRQCHHLVRTVPGRGHIIHNATESAIDKVLAMGCWTPCEPFGNDAGWQAVPHRGAATDFDVHHAGQPVGRVRWDQTGAHNRMNALAAVAAAVHAGVSPAAACAALSEFTGVKRRMEKRGAVGGVTVYDDFAHHPTAIATTLEGLRDSSPDSRILAVLEPRSNTMRLGIHRDRLTASLAAADAVFVYTADLAWDAAEVFAGLGDHAVLADDMTTLIAAIVAAARPGDRVVVMSNGGFGGIHERLLNALADR